VPIHTLPSDGGVESAVPAFTGMFRQPPCEHLYQGNAGAFFRLTPDSYDFQAEISWSASALLCSINGLRSLGEWLIAKQAPKRVLHGGAGDMELPYGSALLSKAYEVVAEIGRWSTEPFAVGGLWALTVDRAVGSPSYSIVLGFVAVELADNEGTITSQETLTRPERLAPMMSTLSISRDPLGFVATVPQKITRLEPHHLEIYAEIKQIDLEYSEPSP
jgi:hypothetical protein